MPIHPKRSERNIRNLAIGSAMRVLRGQLHDPTPEERLWLAVIEHAVRDAYSDRANSEMLREDALRWLDSEYFEWVAAALGLHPAWARDKIKRIQEIRDTH